MKFKSAIISLLLFLLITVNVSGQELSSKSGVVEISGIKLSYTVEGQGIPCLVLGSSVYYPRLFSNELRKDFLLYFVDQRFFTADSRQQDLSKFSIDQISDEIEEMRKALKLEKFVIIGHSIYGNVVIEYARKYPEHLSHIVAIANPPQYASKSYSDALAEFRKTAEPERLEKLEKNWEMKKDSIDKLPPREKFIATYVTNGPLYWYDFNFDCSALWKNVPVNIEPLNALFQKAYANYDISSNSTLIKQPVLVILGKYDFLVPHFMWDSSKPNIPHLTVKIFNKSGHSPQFEEPALFNQTLLNWVKGSSR